jgi:hypothetical protein
MRSMLLGSQEGIQLRSGTTPDDDIIFWGSKTTS